MSRAPDLFSYPQAAGWTEPLTSRAAAFQMVADAHSLRAKVLVLIESRPGGLSVHEAAALLYRSVPSVQPRFSELLAQGRIERSGDRRKNDSGMSAAVWIAKRKI